MNNQKQVIITKSNFSPATNNKLEVYLNYSVIKEGDFECTIVLTEEEYKKLQNIIINRPDFYVDKSVPNEDIISLIMNKIKE